MKIGKAKVGMRVKMSEDSDVVYTIDKFWNDEPFLVHLVYDPLNNGRQVSGGTADVSQLIECD